MAGSQLGEAFIPIRATLDKLDKDLDSARSKVSGAVSKIGGALGEMAKIAGGILAAQVFEKLAAGAVNFAKSSINAASDLNESMNKVNVVFGEAAAGVQLFALNAATSLGISNQQALEGLGTFGNLFTAMGIGTAQSADMSQSILTLAADLASFNNLDPTEVLVKLRAGLVGEAEPLRTLGVNINQATIEAKAMELGLMSVGGELTAGAKAQASYALIMEQTTSAQGDFARTSDGLANSQRILKAQVEDAKATFGTAFLPVIEKVTGFVTSSVMPAFKDFAATAGPWLAGQVQIFFDWASDTLMPFLQNTVYPWIKENLPKAIQTLSDFWTDTLKPAILAVWSWMSTVLIPFLVDTVFPWLQEHIPAALQTLSDFWTGTLQPAIEAVWSWMSGTLIPFLQDVVAPWLAEHIPEAIQTLSDFWTNTLQPAIEAVWTFLTVDMMPVWEALGELFSVAFPVIIQALVDAWNNVLKPALEAIWNFVKDNIIPIFTGFSDSIGGISGAIETLVGWIQTAIEWFKKFKPPEDLMGDSPSPFEISLRGIEKALKDVDNLMANSLFANPPDWNIGGILPAGALAGMEGGSASQSNYTATTTIYTNQDPMRVLHAARHLDKLGSFT